MSLEQMSSYLTAQNISVKSGSAKKNSKTCEKVSNLRD
jgi:hypothetical protein